MKEMNLAQALQGAYFLMNDYLKFCNNHHEELDDGAGNYYTVKPTFNGFKAFLDERLKIIDKNKEVL